MCVPFPVLTCTYAFLCVTDRVHPLQPAATFAVCASRRVGDRATRYGAWMAIDNVGTPRFERADPAAMGPAVRRYIATQRESAAATGERPMAYVANEPPGAAGPPPEETRL